MSKTILMDEIHLWFLVPRKLPLATANAVRRVLQSRPFRSRLRGAVRSVIEQFPELEPVQLRVTR